MNVAIRLSPDRDDTAHAVARVDVLDTIAAAEPPWRQLEAGKAIATPFQRYDWVALWQRHLGDRQGTSPAVVVGWNAAGEPLFLWPLVRVRRGMLTLARFAGGKHSNLNLGIWRRDIAASISAEELEDILARLARSGIAIDLLSFTNQPAVWEEIANPFALLPHQASPNENYRLTLGAPAAEVIGARLSSSMRGRLRTRERKLASLDGYRYVRATTPAEVDRLLDAFFVQKGARLAAQGLNNIFAEPGTDALLREACRLGLEAGHPLIEMHALLGGDEVLAMFAGLNDGRRFSSMFNSYTLSEHARWSPGLLLVRYLVESCADRGLQSFDLGPGEASYKTVFCKETEALFDSFLPLTPMGRLAAAAAQSAALVKGKVKRSRTLWSVVQAARGISAKVRGSAQPAADND